MAHFRYSLIPVEDHSITLPSEHNGNHRNKPINTKKTTKCLQGKTIYNMLFCKRQPSLLSLEGIFKLAFDLVLGNLQHKKEKTKMVFDSIVMNDGANNNADRIDKNGLNPCCCRCCCGSCCANPKYDQQTNTSSSRHNHHDNSTTRNQTTRTSSPCHKSTQK